MPALAQPFPPLSGRVVDQAYILDADVVRELTRLSSNLESTTTDQLVIVTVPSLSGMSIENYAQDLGNHWQIGQEGKNNGVIFLIAPNQRELRIETGEGVQSRLTNGIAADIVDEMIIPYFKRGEMSQGIVPGTQHIVDILKGDVVMKEKSLIEKAGEWLLVIILLPFVIIARLLGFGGKFKGRGGSFKGGGGASGKW